MFYRSDHFPFARKGVPGLFIAMGFDHKDKGRDWLIKRNDEWTATCYHSPNDVYVDDPSSPLCWNLDGAVEDIQLLFDIGYKLANSDIFPAWNPKAEFKRE